MFNKGISFGLFPGLSSWIVVFVLVAILVHAAKVRELLTKIGLGLIIIGGTGNLISRVKYGGIVDNWTFLGIFYNNIWDWCIGVGLVIYCYAIYQKGR